MLLITQTALELGFMYALVAMALFLSFRILDVADLTTDGCFVLGAAVSVTLCMKGHPFLALPASMLAGACAGFVTAFLQTQLGVPSILAGIVTNTGLYTINLMAMGFTSNLNLFKCTTIFTLARDVLEPVIGSWYKLAVAVFITLLAALALRLFLTTRLGLSIRATGDNADMVRASSINPAFTITVGLCVSGSLTALSGAVLGQYQKSCDINLGQGMVTIALASLIIGETLVGRQKISHRLFASILGSVIYRFVVAIALRMNVPAECLKLVSAIIVAVAISSPQVKVLIGRSRRKAAARAAKKEGV